MSRLKLSYFDIDGGRGGAARLAMLIGEIPFEDDRIPLAQWPAVKEQMPFHAVPVLEVDGRRLTQSNTINRYVGKLSGLYPEDPWQAALCDEVMDLLEDISTTVVATFKIADEEAKKAAREAIVNGPLTLLLNNLEAFLRARDGGYFCDNRLTIADLRVYIWLKTLFSGTLDYIPTDLVQQQAPGLLAYYEKIGNHPKVAAYFAGE